MAEGWTDYKYEKSDVTVKYQTISTTDTTITMPEDFANLLFVSTEAQNVTIELYPTDDETNKFDSVSFTAGGQKLFAESLPEAHPEKFRNFKMKITGTLDSKPIYLSYGYPLFYYAKTDDPKRPEGWYAANAPVVTEKVMEKPYPNSFWRFDDEADYDMPYLPGMIPYVESIMEKPYPTYYWRFTNHYNNDIPYLPVWPDLETLSRLVPPPPANEPNDDKEFIELLDWVHVVSEPHGLDDYYPVTKMTISLSNPADTSITLNYNTSVSLSSEMNQANAELLDKLGKIPEESAILLAARNAASELIHNGTKGYVTMHYDSETGICDEILISDQPLNTKKDYENENIHVWRWNKNGLGYSDNGYNGNYNTAITKDGSIVADFIATGTMSGDRIIGGILSLGGSVQGKWKNGQFRVYNEHDELATRINAFGVTTIGTGKFAHNGQKQWAIKLKDGYIAGGEIVAADEESKESFVEYGSIHPGVFLGDINEGKTGLWLNGRYISITPEILGIGDYNNPTQVYVPERDATLKFKTQKITIPSAVVAEGEDQPESTEVEVITDVEFNNQSILSNGLEFHHGIAVTSNNISS